MTKGRKFSTNQIERLLGTTNIQSSTTTHEITDFREENMWSVPEDCDGEVNLSPGERDSHGPSRRRNMGHDRRNLGGLSQALENPVVSNVAATSSRIVQHQYRASQRAVHGVATSAPVNVPDWSKILRVDSVESLQDMNDKFDGDESEMVPPHEYLARGRKMAANSVFEGVGRTLKGRDLRRVRDAVWNQTGFDG